MAKRHTDTTLYDQQWFQTLHPTLKCFWLYICSKCDHAGIWDVNIPLARFTIDPNDETKIKFDNLLDIFNGRILDLGNDKWYLKKYVYFHHGEVLHPNNNFHLSIIKSLEKYGLATQNEEGLYAVNQSPDKDAVKTIRQKPTARMATPTVAECVDYFKKKNCPEAENEAEKFWDFYESKGWMVGKNHMKKWHSAAANWLKGVESPKIKSRAYVQEGSLEEERDW